MVCYSTLATSTKAGNHFNLRHMWGHWRGWELLCHLQADCHICLPTLLNARCQRQQKVFSSLWTFSLFVVKLSAVHLSTSWTWSNIAKLNQTNFFILKLSYYTHTTSMFMSSHINRWLFKKRILTKGDSDKHACARGLCTWGWSWMVATGGSLRLRDCASGSGPAKAQQHSCSRLGPT